MIYLLANPQAVAEAKEYLNQAIRNGWKIEIIRKQRTRSLPQNAFFHLLLGYFGMQFGTTMNEPLTIKEAKTEIKREFGDIFVYFKNDKPYIRSSADLTTEEMSIVIDRLYKFAAEQGISLPLVNNEENIDLMKNEIEKCKY